MSYTEIEALKKLKSASLILIITPILIIIGLFLGIGILFSSLASLLSGGVLSALGGVVGSLLLLGILPLVGVILGLIAIVKIRDGFRDLKTVYPKAGIGATGGTLLFWGYIIYILVPLGFILMLVNPFGLVLASIGVIIAGILYFIGEILTAIGYCRVGDRYDENLVSIGGILGLFLPFIGNILTFIGLGRIINRLSMGQQTYSPQPYQQSPLQPSGMPPQPQYQTSSQTQPTTQQFPGQQSPLPQYNQPQAPLPIYQIGPFATLRPDGSVTFQVYSTQPAQLVSARIEDTGNITTNITPNFIPPNQITNVTVNFGSIPIVSGRQYRIIVTAIISNSYVQFPVYANS